MHTYGQALGEKYSPPRGAVYKKRGNRFGLNDIVCLSLIWKIKLHLAKFANNFRSSHYGWQDPLFILKVNSLSAFSATLLSKTGQNNSAMKETKM